MSHQPTNSSSQQPARKKLSVPDIRDRKGGEKLVLLTAYTAPMAELLDPHCDMLMVGDSLGMVIYGMESTLPVTLEMMIAHGKAVVGRAKQCNVVVDMPFGSYQANPSQAFANAARIMKETGCAAVKMEGGSELAPTIRHLTSHGIPVMAHVGLMPQHVNTLGGFKAQGKDAAAHKVIMQAARDVAAAGAFAVVLEGLMEPLAAEITQSISIPTIGIGASPACDGQVLVVDDMMGMFEQTPRFVKKFANLRGEISNAAAHYAKEVRSGQFPGDAQCYGVASGNTKPKLAKKK